MRVPLAILTLALALGGCGLLGDAFESAGEPAGAARTTGTSTAAPDPASQVAAAEAPPAVQAPAPTPGATGAPAEASPAPPRAEQLAVAPSVPAPPRTGPASGADACAEVTASGPAREIDLDGVRQRLRGIDFRRGTFETNAAYRSRVITRLEDVEALAIQRSGRPQLVFSVPIPAYRLTYDAERQALWVGSDLGLLPGGSAIGMGDFILVKSTERQLGRHRSTIAYGARRGQPIEREVTRVTGDQLGLIVPGSSSIGWPSSFERQRIPMPAAEAQQARQSLAVLFVARLQEPYFATGEFIQEAKIDDLVEKRLTVEALRIAIDCAAIYDRRTGRMVRQIMPAGRLEPRV